MTALLILALIVVMGAVVWAVIRGLHAFANMRPEDVDENGVPKSLAIQNKAMFSRVKWQAVAIMIVAVMLVIAGAAGN